MVVEYVPGSIVVQHSTYHPEIEGSNPSTGIGREKMGGNYGPGSVVVQHSTYNPETESSNPATSTQREREREQERQRERERERELWEINMSLVA
jgi:hypothetical protein